MCGENKAFETCSVAKKAWNCTSLRLHNPAGILQGVRTVCFRPAVQTFCRRAAKLTLLNIHVLILGTKYMVD